MGNIMNTQSWLSDNTSDLLTSEMITLAGHIMWGDGEAGGTAGERLVEALSVVAPMIARQATETAVGTFAAQVETEIANVIHNARDRFGQRTLETIAANHLATEEK